MVRNQSIKGCLFLTIIVFINFCPIYVYPQDEKGLLSLNVQGSAQIKQNDVATAREGAIQNALEKAILEAAVKLLSVPVQDENFQLVKGVLLNEPDKYVYYYKITEENRQPQKFIVTADVVVAFSVLKNDLGKMGFLNVNQAEKNNAKVFLSVNGLKKYSDYVRIKEFIQSRIKLVKSIYPGHFEWQHAYFEIELYGNAQSLANELEGNGGCIMEMKQTEHDKIEMTCWQKTEDK
jgi:Flagellar assembly protein T, N-terminal domain